MKNPEINRPNKGGSADGVGQRFGGGCLTKLARLLTGVVVTGALVQAASAADSSTLNSTPNVFLRGGRPTFVVGTGGDKAANRAILAQAEAIRDRLFATAPIVLDESIAVDKGAAAWPANPVVYGGPHVNRVLARLASSLPFKMERGKLVLGDKVFEGEDYRLITVVPARAADDQGPGYPRFLLYAGTGSPGVTEINKVWHGGEPILIADSQDRRLFRGEWEKTDEGRVEAVWFGQGLPAAKRLEYWREDLRTYASVLPAKHKNFDKLISPEQFTREVSEVESALPRLSDNQVVLRLMRLTASLRVAHTKVDWPSERLQFHQLPLTLRWFADGLWVTGAAREWREALGTRVVRIGSITPEKLEGELAPYIAHENQAWLHHCSPGVMIIPEVLRELKVSDPDGAVPFTFARAEGTNVTLRLSGAALNTVGESVVPTESLEPPKPLCFKAPGRAYWREYLPDSKTLYVQYNRCVNEGAEPFTGFSSRLFAFADSNEVARLIVDLRFNGGGNSSVIDPLLRGLRSRSALRAKGRLYALIGPRTFSSGLMAAQDLRELGATLVGEPTGGKPNCYGEVKNLQLPHSRLQVSYSVKYFQRDHQGDPASLEPDILIQQTFGEFMAGTDPVVEKVLSLGPSPLKSGGKELKE